MARSKDDIYAEITEAFLTAIRDHGTVPWRKGWRCDGILPANFQSKRPYRGMNSLWLGMVQQARGYTTPYWSTYRAAEKSGGQVRKGEKSQIGTVVAVGKGGIGKDCVDPSTILKVGDRVMYGKYSGEDLELKDKDGKDVEVKVLEIRSVRAIVK